MDHTDTSDRSIDQRTIDTVRAAILETPGGGSGYMLAVIDACARGDAGSRYWRELAALIVSVYDEFGERQLVEEVPA